jgi:hypothetical protein
MNDSAPGRVWQQEDQIFYYYDQNQRMLLVGEQPDAEGPWVAYGDSDVTPSRRDLICSQLQTTWVQPFTIIAAIQ